MRLLAIRNEPQELGETLKSSLDALSGKFNPTKGKILTVGLVAGGLAALTAASAGISSLRRRLEGATDDS